MTVTGGSRDSRGRSWNLDSGPHDLATLCRPFRADARYGGPLRLPDDAWPQAGHSLAAARRDRSDQDVHHLVPPQVELVQPRLGHARRVIRRAAAQTSLAGDQVLGLVAVTNEMLTNALSHGRPPVWLRVWVAGDRVLVALTDAGTGPAPAAIAALAEGAGRAGGLWIASQLCTTLVLDASASHFTAWAITVADSGGETSAV